jgi:hypothetical protein
VQVIKEKQDVEATYQTTADFYTVHHPDIFGDDLDVSERTYTENVTLNQSRNGATPPPVPLSKLKP